MIDPRQDLNGAIAEIQCAVLSMASSLTAALPAIRVSIADIAKDQGVSKSTVYREKWRMPGFGKPDAGESPVEFWLSTYLAWVAIPEAKRRSEWETMPRKQREKVSA